MEFLLKFWSEIALAILVAAGSITALTETQADDNIVNILKRILQAVVFGKNRRRK
jgi:hypothetical protein|tara:strand:+ start:159 stop:323 length:165 start_codon:yes stop_codon:yes gene_type:complete